jgi:hypothetical protein
MNSRLIELSAASSGANISKASCRSDLAHYRTERSPHWVKVKNPNAPAVTREAEEEWGALSRLSEKHHNIGMCAEFALLVT